MKKISRKANIEKPKKRLSGIVRISGKPMGFLKLDDKDEEVVIFEENLNCALDKDEVEVEVIGRDRDRKKGRIVKILQRNKEQFVGTLEARGSGLIFIPDDWRFYRNMELPTFGPEAKAGLKALVALKSWTNPNLNPQGRIVSIIGEKGKHETEMQSILLDKGIVYNFPHDVEKEAEEIDKRWKEGKADNRPNNRRDFRGVTTFTIDPADAKDFDDALSYREIDSDRIEVGVHIADVSNFVRPGTALDREARKRSFSTYLVDRTIPMLPEVLSNGLCSLNPHEDRFAFGAVFEIERQSGKILNRWFGKTLINSNKRFSYEEAQEVLNLGRGQGGGAFYRELSELMRLSKIYREANKKEGAIEFETDEVRFELDSEGKPVRVYKKARLDTMKMIEEWMLLANREVAKFISDKLGKKGGASIYRVHDLPNMEKLESLAVFIRALGHDLPIRNGEVSAKDINKLLLQIQGHASESLIKTATIRSMAKATYSTKNIGHFGLAFEYYTHFTSPIRRYPDLVIHRILENHLTGGQIRKDEIAYFQKICDEASDKEIIVAEAERDSIKYKQVEFMLSKVGQEFECVISGVTEWGMYVEEPNTKAEGMIRLRDIKGDYFEVDAEKYAIVGQKTKKKFVLGDAVRVKLVSADLDRKTLDFELV